MMRGDNVRNPETMFHLIENVALKDDNVRAVVLNGSRARPDLRVDIFSDYDVVYFVEDFNEAKQKNFQDLFGETLIVHTSEDMIYMPDPSESRFIFQMLFKDKNRIDLSIRPISYLEKHLEEEPIYKVLIDKDERLNMHEKAELSVYTVDKPSEALYRSAVNTFLWLEPYVAKGLYRHEHIYALKHFTLLRDALETMLKWRMGVQTKFDAIMGKDMKHMRHYLGEDVYNEYLKTYTTGETKKIWSALFYIHDYFIKQASYVGKKLGYAYEWDKASDMKRYLKEIRGLSMSESDGGDVESML